MRQANSLLKSLWATKIIYTYTLVKVKKYDRYNSCLCRSTVVLLIYLYTPMKHVFVVGLHLYIHTHI